MSGAVRYLIAGSVLAAGAGVLVWQLGSGGSEGLPVSPTDAAMQPTRPAGGPGDGSGGGPDGGPGGGTEDIEIAPTVEMLAPGSADAADAGGSEGGPVRRREVRNTGQQNFVPAEWQTELPELRESTYVFQPAAEFDTSSSDVARAMDSAQDLGSLSPARRTNLHQVWAAMAKPLIAGDRDGFISAMDAMGVQGNPDASAPASGRLYDMLSDLVAGSEIDLGAARIRSVDADDPRQAPVVPPGIDLPAGAIPMMMTRNEDESGSSSALTLPLGALFPIEREIRSYVEVWAPARFEGSEHIADRADVGFSLFFAFDGSVWKPSGVRVVGLSEGSSDRIRNAARPPSRG